MVLKMSNTKDFPLGARAPGFELLEPLTGKTVQLGDLRGVLGTLICFLSVHCPYVVNQHAALTALGADLMAMGVGMAAISSNDATHAASDGPDGIAQLAGSDGPFSTFPFLYDDSQDVAKAYFAVCTPDFYLLDAEDKLVYRGRLDGSTPGNSVPVDGSDMRAAVQAMAEGMRISEVSIKPSMGCSIKWKPGNAPDYF
jgi:hypothetical protein